MILQHWDAFKGDYKSFITYIEFDKSYEYTVIN